MKLIDSIKNNFLLILIFIAGIVLRVYAALQDKFMHDWDERYHALVARNMMDTPLKPMLNKVMLSEYDINAWCCNHIWLHKQPLFLWQIALSMKLFGVSHLTLRLPSILMGSLMILILYRVCFLLTKEKIIAILSSAFMCFSCYQLDLISGRKGMDHNDVAFGFYVLCSIWALCEYLSNDINRKWVMLIGFFAGCAVLNKWLTGLLVFAPWGLLSLYNLYVSKKISSFRDISISLVVALIVFLPWQCYAFYKYPEIAEYEMRYNSLHLFDAVEGHSGSYFYYVNNLDMYLGRNVFIFFLLSFVALIASRKIYSKLHFVLISSFCTVLLFFSLIVTTKIDSYVFIVMPLAFIYAAIATHTAFSFFTKNKYLIYAGGFVLIFYLSAPLIFFTDAKKDKSYAQRTYDDSVYYHLKKIIPADTKIVLNVLSPHHLDLMFYHKDLIALPHSVDHRLMSTFAKFKIKIAAFCDHPQGENPDYIRNYPYLFTIPVKQQ